MNDMVPITPTARTSVLIAMSEKYGMDPRAFESTLRATVIKPDKHGNEATREEFAAFLLVAKEYDLNPLTKEIYAFVDRGVVTPIVSIDGWANIINSHPMFDGMDFADAVDPDKGIVTAITCRMHRKDRHHPTEVTEYLAECKRDTDPWRKWPRRMLRHKAMIQAARYAFGFAGIYDPDEAERIADETARDVTMHGSRILSKLQSAPPTSDPTGFDPQHVDAVTGEILNTSQGVSPAPETAPATLRAGAQDAEAGETGPASASVGDLFPGDMPRDDAQLARPSPAYVGGQRAAQDGVSRKAIPADVDADEWLRGYDDARRSVPN